jgi:hypothetical protein
MPRPLTRRETRILRQWHRLTKLEAQAKGYWDLLDRKKRELAHQLKTGPVRINEDGLHLLVEDQFAQAIMADEAGNDKDSKLWAHGAARRWNFVTKNLG